MLISVRWLHQIFDTGLAPGELVDVLNRAGLEVEGTTDLGMGSGKIVVARVLEVERHPNADSLCLVRADVGGGEPARIVCGATNLVPGMTVPCALPGAVMPEGMKIKKSKIRGEASEGMLCSARELGFGADHSGIMALPDALTLGEPFDYLIDAGVTPDRPDWLSMTGVAREVAAMIDKPFEPPRYEVQASLEEPTSKFVRLDVRAPAGCPRYACRFIQGVGIGESPLWVRRALEAVGLRPINNVVDATNYALHELGHPLHAFDADRLRGGAIVVRMAGEGEPFTALDGKEVKLSAEDLVIADGEGPIALAGVIGGANSEVTEATKNIALECAYFDPSMVRRTARRHGFNTDASYRFERGTDRVGLINSLERAAGLIQELAGGEIAPEPLDAHTPPAGEAAPIELSIERTNAHLGLALEGDEVAGFLGRLGFEVKSGGNGALQVTPPTYRLDAKIDVDLIEEVARIYGYDRIPETMPAIASRLEAGDAAPGDAERELRRLLTGRGLSEAVHYSFIGDDAAARFGFDPAGLARLANPLTTGQTVMRPTLLPALVEAIERNQRHGAASIALFEIGRVFNPGAEAGDEEHEPLKLGIALAGSVPGNWTGAPRPYDFADVRGAIEAIGALFSLGEMTARAPAEGPAWHPGRGARVVWNKREIGALGELHPALAEDIKGRAYLAEIDLRALFKLAAGRGRRFRAIPRFPASERDLAVVVDRSRPAGDLLGAARRAGKPLVESIEVIDVYRGEHVAGDKQSIAMRFRLRSPDATLTEEQIADAMRRILAELESKCGAALRT